MGMENSLYKGRQGNQELSNDAVVLCIYVELHLLQSIKKKKVSLKRKVEVFSAPFSVHLVARSLEVN